MKYSIYHLITIFYLLTSVVTSAHEAIAEEPRDHQYLLNKAEYFLYKDPNRSLSLMAEIDLAADLERDVRLQTLLLQAKALLIQRQNIAAQLPISRLYDFVQSSEFNDNLFEHLYVAATWLRRTNHPQAASSAYRCTLKHSQTERHALRALNGLANVLREQGDFATAAAMYQKAISKAQKVQDQAAIASLQNNLGTVYLDDGKFTLAKTAFGSAFKLFQIIDHQAARLNSGLNLLFAALMSKDTELYQRIILRVERLALEFNDKSRLAYLEWIQSAYQFQQGEQLSDEHRDHLTEQFSRIEELGLQRGIKQHLATPMAVTVAMEDSIKTEPLTEYGDWVSTLIQCNW